MATMAKTRTLTCAVAVVVLALQLRAGLAVRTQPRTARPMEDSDPVRLFEKFQKDHSKVYENEAERVYRLGVFKRNLEVVRELNVMEDDATYGITKFFDMTETEFASKILMRPQLDATHPRQGHVPTGDMTDVPDSWDWRDHGAVTRVKNQGTVGTCWAFSAVGNIEGQMALVDGTLESLSVEQISDCDGGSFPSNNTGDCGVFGGWPWLAYEYVTKAGGLQLDSDYPYCMLNETCWPCAAPGYNATICGPPQPYCKKSDSCHFDKSKAAVQVSTWASLSSDEEELKAQLHKNGPVSILVDASPLYIYWGGVVKGHLCGNDWTSLNHAVLLVGYGTEKNVWGQEVPYWIIKNSWGEDWGEKGYFRLLRSNDCTCGVCRFPTTSIL